jgi:hypothetical protein
MVSSNDWMPVMILHRKHLGLLALLPLLLWSCQAEDPTANAGMSEPGVLASGYWIPDGIAVIAEGEFLFADRGGTLYHYKGGGVTAVRGLPRSRTSGVFGGLLDVSLHPSFPDSRLVYVAYNDNAFDLTVARFELRDERAERLSVIYKSDEFSIGSRIEWQDSSHFFLSFGVGGDPHPAPGPQDLSADVGKIHRLTVDGQIPPDNPILPGAVKRSTIWSYGHRNPQGLYYDAIKPSNAVCDRARSAWRRRVEHRARGWQLRLAAVLLRPQLRPNACIRHVGGRRQRSFDPAGEVLGYRQSSRPVGAPLCRG